MILSFENIQRTIKKEFWNHITGTYFYDANNNDNNMQGPSTKL